ncbi:hypothetical protein OC834_008009, partial [Tilletia horrida]
RQGHRHAPRPAPGQAPQALRHLHRPRQRMRPHLGRIPEQPHDHDQRPLHQTLRESSLQLRGLHPRLQRPPRRRRPRSSHRRPRLRPHRTQVRHRPHHRSPRRLRHLRHRRQPHRRLHLGPLLVAHRRPRWCRGRRGRRVPRVLHQRLRSSQREVRTQEARHRLRLCHKRRPLSRRALCHLRLLDRPLCLTVRQHVLTNRRTPARHRLAHLLRHRRPPAPDRLLLPLEDSQQQALPPRRHPQERPLLARRQALLAAPRGNL